VLGAVRWRLETESLLYLARAWAGVRVRVEKESMLHPKCARPHRARAPSGAVVVRGMSAAKRIWLRKSGESMASAPQHMSQ
jgi:hypothetical protein